MNQTALGLVMVFPSVTARAAVEPRFLASGYSGTTNGAFCFSMLDGFFASNWLAVENVLIDVHVSPSGATATQRALIDRIRAALANSGP